MFDDIYVLNVSYFVFLKLCLRFPIIKVHGSMSIKNFVYYFNVVVF